MFSSEHVPFRQPISRNQTNAEHNFSITFIVSFSFLSIFVLKEVKQKLFGPFNSAHGMSLIHRAKLFDKQNHTTDDHLCLNELRSKANTSTLCAASNVWKLNFKREQVVESSERTILCYYWYDIFIHTYVLIFVNFVALAMMLEKKNNNLFLKDFYWKHSEKVVLSVRVQLYRSFLWCSNLCLYVSVAHCFVDFLR